MAEHEVAPAIYSVHVLFRYRAERFAPRYNGLSATFFTQSMRMRNQSVAP
jgi:hypothetical protein